MKKYIISNASTSNIKVCFKDTRTNVIQKILIPACSIGTDDNAIYVDESSINEFECALEFWKDFLILNEKDKDNLADINESREEKRLKKVKADKNKEIKSKLSRFNNEATEAEDKQYFVVEEPKEK